MSNVYILEPPTSGKVLLKTTVGEIDIELWAKETPKTCRNFIQLCMEGYYNGTIFHRVVKGFIAQGGDPSGDGTGGESIYGGTFKDEFHQRLRFARRGLLAMANAGPDDNASQFFFTLAATPELQNKHTIFGKVTGETLFNMLKLEEGLIEDERPVYPHKILKTEVLHNPFPDIEPRILEPVVKESKKKKKDKTPGVKNFKLLSFGAEAEEDEEESSKVNEKYAGKGKSTHDVLDDPKLSSQTLDQPNASKNDKKDKNNEGDDDDDDSGEESDSPDVRLENIRKKLKLDRKEKKPAPIITSSYYDEDEKDQRKRKYEEIKKEIESVKREYHQNKLKRIEEKEEEKKELEIHENFKEYKDEYKKYKTKTKELPKKGAGREAFTLELLSKFKKKLNSAKDSKESSEDKKESDEDDIDNDENWLAHKLHFKDDTPVLAKDANTKDDDWFEIYDPRNPLNKRRRGDTTNKTLKK